jgi:6-pyruvoyltetrahydropterin/6-carboxytetrahydropterin synthase
MYQSTKTYGHELGLSCCFRQWRADSHCSLLHGYAISVKLTFESPTLDGCGWVMDFGGLKPIKKLLEQRFDHKTIVAEDDPEKDYICSLAGLGIADVIVVPATGCEAFAFQIYNMVALWLHENHGGRVSIASVEVREHGANSAIFKG